MTRRTWLWIDVSLKALVIGLTALGAFGGLERFEEKGFGWRLVWYPAMILALPIAWRLFGRGRPFPFVADVLITLPFFVDIMGNVLNLYDSIDWWDDVNHFLNWLFLSLGIGTLLLRTRLQPLVVAGMILAWGSTSAILWELGEYATFIRTNEDEFATAYTDTLGDLGLDLLGTLIAAAAIFYVARTDAERGTASRELGSASASRAR